MKELGVRFSASSISVGRNKPTFFVLKQRVCSFVESAASDTIKAFVATGSPWLSQCLGYRLLGK